VRLAVKVFPFKIPSLALRLLGLALFFLGLAVGSALLVGLRRFWLFGDGVEAHNPLFTRIDGHSAWANIIIIIIVAAKGIHDGSSSRRSDGWSCECERYQYVMFIQIHDQCAFALLALRHGAVGRSDYSLTDGSCQRLLARRGDSCCQKKISSSFAYYLTKAMLPQHDAKLEEIAQLLKNNNVAEVSNSQLFGRFHCVLMASSVGSRE